MKTRLSGAFVRAILVALVAVTPALMVPLQGPDRSQLIILLALIAAGLTFVEYSAKSPSIVEFREAPPFNRLRFLALVASVLALSVICRGQVEPTLLSEAVTSAGMIVGNLIDVPGSPLWLVILMLPGDAGADLVDAVRAAAGMACLVSLVTLATFAVLIRVTAWPIPGRAFNLWVNLPVFDPEAGGDVAALLRRDARVNVGLGILLAYLIPPVVKLAGLLLDPVSLANPHALIWVMTAWAFLPASMIMRGLALGRVAEMIGEQRRRGRSVRRGTRLQPV